MARYTTIDQVPLWKGVRGELVQLRDKLIQVRDHLETLDGSEDLEEPGKRSLDGTSEASEGTDAGGVPAG